MPVAETAWGAAVELLDGCDEVALACHVDPDGDALGSMLAFSRFLRSRGVRTVASFGASRQGDAFTVPPSDAGLLWSAVYRDDLDELAVAPAETDGLIDVGAGTDAGECALVCKEQPGGRWKASLRSKGGVDVGSVAARLGGGGHAGAAGFTAGGTLDDVVGRVVAALAPPAAGAATVVRRAG